MKPFDLEAAKRGEPIVTRGGREAKFIAHLPEAHPPFRVNVLIDGETHGLFESGDYWDDPSDSPNDLFMAPKKRTVWVNLYDFRQSSDPHWYLSEESADIAAKEDRIGGKAYPVEIEE